MKIKVPLPQEILQAILFCPYCAQRHVDQDEWATRPHHTHLCSGCGKEWRVEPYCAGSMDVDLMAPNEDDGLEEEQVQAVALALAELSLRRPGWEVMLREIALHYNADLLFAQFRKSSRDTVPEAPDSPLVSEVENARQRVAVLERANAMLVEEVRELNSAGNPEPPTETEQPAVPPIKIEDAPAAYVAEDGALVVPEGASVTVYPKAAVKPHPATPTCTCPLGVSASTTNTQPSPRKHLGTCPLFRRCNRHGDCDAADAYAASQGKRTHHCHDEDCEDCFGK